MFTRGSNVNVEQEERAGRGNSEGGKAHVVNADGGETEDIIPHRTTTNHPVFKQRRLEQLPIE
jgi:hypothetical protein